MELTVRQECPQCGGMCELGEASRLLICPYCGVRLLLGDEVPHYLLPCKKKGETIIWAPYLRLKGAIFSCSLDGISHRLVDTTMTGIKMNVLPASLGFRPQAMPLHFPHPDQPGLFLRNRLKLPEALKAASARLHEFSHDSTAAIHEEWIGERASILSLPLVSDGATLYDGVTGDGLARLPEEKDFFHRHGQNKPPFCLTLLSSLCPQCGWDLDCHEQSIILFCHNCDTAWQMTGNTLQPVPYQTRVGQQRDSVHLPFWAMEADISGVKLATFADFLRLTNIPMAIKPHWEEQKMIFYCPAFRLNSKIFLRIASQITLHQIDAPRQEQIPASVQPANLSADEAVETIKLTLANSAVAKRNILPLLADIVVTTKKVSLTLLPFFDNGRELCQEESRVNINKQALQIGQKI